MSESNLYTVYETYFQFHLGYSLSKDCAIKIAEKRYSEIKEEGPDTWNHVIVRQLPLDKLLTYEEEYQSPIVWQSD